MTASVHVEYRFADDIARLGRRRPIFHNGPQGNIDPATGPIASQGWIIPSGPDSCPEIMETRGFCVNLQDSGELGPPSANARWPLEVMTQGAAEDLRENVVNKPVALPASARILPPPERSFVTPSDASDLEPHVVIALPFL